MKKIIAGILVILSTQIHAGNVKDLPKDIIGCAKVIAHFLRGTRPDVQLPWKDYDDFFENHLDGLIDGTDIVMHQDIVALNKKSRYYSSDHRFNNLKKVAQGDYTHPSKLPDNFTFSEHEIKYNPLLFKQKLPWIRVNPFAKKFLKSVMKMSDTQIRNLEEFGQSRKIRVLTPKSPRPENGHPVVLLSHGFKFPHKITRSKDAPYGGYHEARLIHGLVEKGYAVVLMEAEFDWAWFSNGIAARHLYYLTSDYHYLKETINWINKGKLKDIDRDTKFAIGISSGGYNTSRLANQFPHEFQAVGIHSSGYMKNIGNVPLFNNLGKINPNHPPVLFMNGVNDDTVPLMPTMAYFKKLKEQRTDATMALFDGGHEWNEKNVEVYLEFFRRILSEKKGQ